MSSTEKQSVERCKYRHDWKAHTSDAGATIRYFCGKCNYQPATDSKLYKEAEAIIHLYQMIAPGDTVYTILRHVSRSGMTRGIDCYIMSVESLDLNGSRENCASCGCRPSTPHYSTCTGGLHDLKQVARPVWITGYVGHAIGSPQPMDYWRKSMGLKVGGCGMDMGFHVVNTLSRVLFADHERPDYALKHEWL